MKEKTIIILGSILLICGIIGAFISYSVIIKDPSEVCEEKFIFTYEDTGDDDYYGSTGDVPPETLTLDKGEYDIWYEPDSQFFGIAIGSPGEVIVEDPNGETVFSQEKILSTNEEEIDKGAPEYRLFGTFDAQESGVYTITVSDPSTVYITPHINVGLGKGLGALSIVVCIIGVILIIMGFYLKYARKKEATKPVKQEPQPYHYPPYPAQYPSYPGYPYPYPPPPPPRRRSRESSGEDEHPYDRRHP